MSLKAIQKAIRKHRTFLVTTHVNPDIDGLSSQLSMLLYLRSLGKKVFAVNVGKTSPMHKFLPAINWVRQSAPRNVSFDAAIIVDCGDLERIGSVKKLIGKNTVIINIDHHVTNNYFGGLNLVEAKASSTAEVLFRFFKGVRFKITSTVAKLLYLGIMTDTGSFRYDNTTSGTHVVVSELLKFRFSVHKFYKVIYETIPLNDLRLFMKLMNCFEMTHRGRVASIVLTPAILKNFSREFDLRDKIFSFLRGIKGIEVIVIFTQVRSDFTRVNFRSQGKADVAKLASLFNGGGHVKASGCSIDAGLHKAKARVLAAIPGILN